MHVSYKHAEEHMTRRVQGARDGRSAAAMVPVFSSTCHHPIPVANAELRRVGILTQTHLARAQVRGE